MTTLAKKHRPVPQAAFDTPMEISVIDSEVVMLGPGGLGLSMTRAAARVTQERLTFALAEADPKRP